MTTSRGQFHMLFAPDGSARHREPPHEWEGSARHRALSTRMGGFRPAKGTTHKLLAQAGWKNGREEWKNVGVVIGEGVMNWIVEACSQMTPTQITSFGA